MVARALDVERGEIQLAVRPVLGADEEVAHLGGDAAVNLRRARAHHPAEERIDAVHEEWPRVEESALQPTSSHLPACVDARDVLVDHCVPYAESDG